MTSLRPTAESTHPSRGGLPASLRGTQAPGWIPELQLAMWEIGSLRNFVYLIADPESRQAMIVDPQKDLREPLQTLEREGLDLTEILLTHTHFDHIAGVPELLVKFPRVKVRVGKEDLWRLKSVSSEQLEPISGGARLAEAPSSVLGLKTQFRYLAAPGHSAGALLTVFQRAEHTFALTGDTFFVRDCGRTDLETGSSTAMFETLQLARKELPLETIFLCGHHYAGQIATPLAAEIEESAPFLCQTATELEELP